MLIEFSVANFRSIRERQTLSMVASNSDSSLLNNLIDVDLPGLKNTKFLKSAAIYGANASGKSNVLLAAMYMRKFVLNSTTSVQPGGTTYAEPFRLDTTSEAKPSEFEVLFVYNGVRYQYGFSVDTRRVHEEWLIAYPAGSPQSWFTRSFNSRTTMYDWKFSQKHFRGSRLSLAEKTRDNALFLSTGAQLNHEQLTLVSEWFNTHFSFMMLSPTFGRDQTGHSLSYLDEDEAMRRAVLAHLQQADLGIADLAIVKRALKDQPIILNMDEESKQAIPRELMGSQYYDLFFLHRKKGSDEKEVFGPDEESEGTMKLLAVSGRWRHILDHGLTVLVDEIGAFLHPMLVRQLISMIHNPALNRHGAQLIFTTHDTTQLDTKFLRRDQIWLTEKDEEGATHLYPLTDFKPRKDEALQKGYLAGRYGAIPFLEGEFTFE